MTPGEKLDRPFFSAFIFSIQNTHLSEKKTCKEQPVPL